MIKKMSLALVAAALLSTSSVALAGKTTTIPTTTTTITKGATTTVSVTVKNPSRTATLAAIVNITATDSTGRLVANLGAPAVVAPAKSLTVSRSWTAPSYATTLAWKAKAVPWREDPISHANGWMYPRLQHRMTTAAKNPQTCVNCHKLDPVNKDAPMNCYNCHDKKWN